MSESKGAAIEVSSRQKSGEPLRYTQTKSRRSPRHPHETLNVRQVFFDIRQTSLGGANPVQLPRDSRTPDIAAHGFLQVHDPL
jgi:hypothetical protein